MISILYKFIVASTEMSIFQGKLAFYNFYIFKKRSEILLLFWIFVILLKPAHL